MWEIRSQKIRWIFLDPSELFAVVLLDSLPRYPFTTARVCLHDASRYVDGMMIKDCILGDKYQNNIPAGANSAIHMGVTYFLASFDFKSWLSFYFYFSPPFLLSQRKVYSPPSCSRKPFSCVVWLGILPAHFLTLNLASTFSYICHPSHGRFLKEDKNQKVEARFEVKKGRPDLKKISHTYFFHPTIYRVILFARTRTSSDTSKKKYYYSSDPSKISKLYIVYIATPIQNILQKKFLGLTFAWCSGKIVCIHFDRIKSPKFGDGSGEQNFLRGIW